MQPDTPTLWNRIFGVQEDPTLIAERALLSCLKNPYKLQFIPSGDCQVNTLIMGRGPPLLLLHGYGSGLGQWIRNLDPLSEMFTIYACDMVGWGRSSRPPFLGKTPEEAEKFHIDYIHGWIESLNLNSFILAGHSFGAYLTTCYMLTYNNPKCKKIILVDPWGVPRRPEEKEEENWRRTLINSVSGTISPFAILRAAGPWGQDLLGYFRSDLIGKFEDFEDPQVYLKYIYHLNALSPSGEDAFQLLKIPFAHAILPLVDRLVKLDVGLKVSWIYGKKTWMDIAIGHYIVRNMFPERNWQIYSVGEAGHHVMLDNPGEFNTTMQTILWLNHKLFLENKITF